MIVVIMEMRKMAKCGIEKYDNLPARVGWVDVDYIRHEYAQTKSKLKALKRILDDAVKENV